MRIVILVVLLSIVAKISNAQEFIPLWAKGKMPNSKGIKVKDSVNNERIYQVGTPGIYAFFSSKQENKRAAVLIIPGGGYSRLAYNISGHQLAKWYNTMGINAFVLIHRLPHSPDLKEREKAPLQDAQRAMRIIRSHAAEWDIDLNKVGVMGSSAGGHLAAALGTINDDFSSVGDGLDQQSYRPDFMVLVSPVIDMGANSHKGSRENLLGATPSADLIKKYSLQEQVSNYTPPTFIVHAFDDKTVSPRNSLMFYESLLANGIPSSLHIFNQGGHAIALRNNPGSTNLWTGICEAWLQEVKILEANVK
ncbi:putative xylanase [Pseudopedobacter saltans DSM 12145]|uniref:Xylanase n=1 Tax=Pseudopedobacter saltans (strain ATCC 51119 / DSM 12145 / JCM 21818 / CCUG 39354 / LMG 10337 / NBRC 100064 / NCIMB 13643) TaxID=762903 RepID=F0SCQ6_PSESL|nr:alpha/beta hydrolase [Pseudopedobacter saltans]ADY53900.1 putative xylanase [Pseudopedobacter saltans DSM 12145]